MRNSKKSKVKGFLVVLSGSLLLNLGVFDNTASANGNTSNNEYIDRLELINLISKYEDSQEVNDDFKTKLKYKDVNLDDVNLKETFINLINKGSLSNSEVFNPNSDLTRIQLAQILVNYFGLKSNYSYNIKINDLNIKDKNYKNIQILVDNGIFKLDKNNKVYPNKKITKTELINILNNYITLDNFLDKDGKIKIEYFKYLLEIEKLNKKENKILEYDIGSTQDMQKVIQDINKELPDRVEIKSSFFKGKDLKSLYYRTEGYYDVSSVENLHNLANYKEMVSGNKLIVTDISKKGYSASEIKSAYDKFVKVVADNLKGNTEEESLLNIYNYVFDRYKYNAKGIEFMNVGNLGEGEMACNGFSRLMNDLLNEVGIESNIRQGESHYWNTIKLNGVETTVDLTTDIVKNQKYLTLGNSTKEHISNTADIGFYSAVYKNYKYKEVEHLDISIIKK